MYNSDPDLTGKNLSKNIFYFEDMEYFPLLLKRKIVFSNIGIEAEEKFGQVIDGSFSWDIHLKIYGENLYFILRSFSAFICVIFS